MCHFVASVGRCREQRGWGSALSPQGSRCRNSDRTVGWRRCGPIRRELRVARVRGLCRNVWRTRRPVGRGPAAYGVGLPDDRSCWLGRRLGVVDLLRGGASPVSVSIACGCQLSVVSDWRGPCDGVVSRRILRPVADPVHAGRVDRRRRALRDFVGVGATRCLRGRGHKRFRVSAFSLPPISRSSPWRCWCSPGLAPVGARPWRC